jgi:hypothetical protein
MVQVAHLRIWFLAMVLAPLALRAQPAVKSFITVADMVKANPYQVADPTPSGGRTATVMVQETAGAYALTNTWTGTNTSTLIASSTASWAWKLLPIASGPTFYTADGMLNSPRTVDLGTQPLLWRGPGAIASSNINSFSVLANGLVSLSTPSDVTLTPGQHLNLRTPYVSAANAKAGDALTLINAGTGEAEFKTPASASTLYSADGTIASNRIVTLNNKSLSFKGPGPVEFKPVDTFSVDASQYASLKSAGNVILESPGFVSIRTPNVVAGGAQVGQVLTMSGANGVVEFATPVSAGTSNIYNSDGTLTGNRIANLASYSLSLTSTNPSASFTAHSSLSTIEGSVAQLRGNTVALIGTNIVNVQTPNVRNASASVGQVLTLQDATSGRVEYATPASLPTVNIYNSDGTLSSDRTVTGGSRNLIFTNVNSFTAAGVTTTVRGSGALRLVTPGVIAATTTNGQALILQDATSGKAEYLDIPNIYTVDSTLTSARNVNGAGRSLNFNTLSNFVADTTNLLLYGKSSVVLATPHVLGVGGTASVGQVLTLQDAGTGRVEYQTPSNPTPINIYNSDGSLTAPRTLTTGTNSLTFAATGALVQFFNANNFTTSALTNQLYGSQEAQMGGGQRVKFYTPRTGAGSTANGQVLTIIDAANSLVDFHPAYNLYLTNGTLSGDRIVDGNFRELSFTNMNHFSARGRTSTIGGSLEFRLRTPNVAGSTAATNQVLTLLDATTGRAEYTALPAATVDTSIYKNDGSVTGNRSVTVPTGMYLRTIGQGSTILNTDTATVSSTNTTIVGSQALILAATGAGAAFNLRTPRFYNGLAKDGDVLMMTNRAGGLGDADYFPPSNLYNNNGTLIGNRTITGGGFSLTSSGLNVFQMAGTTMRLYCGASGEMILATPKIMGGTADSPYPAVAGWVLTLRDAASGRVEYAPLPSGTSSGDYSSIYANDGLITTNMTSSTRTVNFPGVRLLFLGNQNATGSAFDIALDNSGTGRFSTAVATNDIYASKLMRIGGLTSTIINTPGTYANAAARNGWVLAWDGAKSEYVPLSTGQDINIYSTNGTLSSNRLLTGAGFDMIWNGINNLDLRGSTATMGGTSALNLRTPAVASATAGQVLTLQASDGTGRAEFNAPANIYTTDGTVPANRFVTVSSGANLEFGGSGNFATKPSLTRADIYGLSVSAIGAKDVAIGSYTNLGIVTPNIFRGLAVPGQVLTLQTTGGTAEFATPAPDTSIYNSNGTLTGTRTVTLNSQTLTFQGFGNVAFNSMGTYDVASTSRTKLQSSGEMEIGGNSVLRVKTPKVNLNNGSVSVGQVLTLTNLDGSCEFTTPSGSTGGGYTGDAIDSGTGNLINSLFFAVNNVSPAYTTTGEYPFGTRLTVRVSRPNGNAWQSMAASNYLQMGSGPQVAIYAPDGNNIATGDLFEGVIMNVIYTKNVGMTGFNGFVMMNTGWKSSSHSALAANFSVTNAVSAKITTVAFAGVVDTFADLADLPLTLKKVSTLGNLAVGDHGHADYYLTLYDPAVGGNISVRSAVDATKMWRKLE